ncbi:Ubiquitin carboxyl-terminal hydrolase 15 [Trichinella spiralis]|uniref:ubiquitinyl hydrolase 1 n=1 Tax=Trichinella spiralis TaxID=6334 RepID=A0A0V1AWL1_TRISP|nr:Ubiquitin carboxyl-terminal hydrolase 15 [Trichinella spiralis]
MQIYSIKVQKMLLIFVILAFYYTVCPQGSIWFPEKLDYFAKSMTISKACDKMENSDKAFADEIMGAAHRFPQKDNDIWYIIDSQWLDDFAAYYKEDSVSSSTTKPPGPIDNSRILEVRPNSNEQTLKDGLRENEDFYIIPTDAWDKLVEKYGLVSGQKPIARKVISRYSSNKTEYRYVEVYPLELTVYKHNDRSNIKQLTLSIASTFDDLIRAVNSAFDLDLENFRLYVKLEGDLFELINPKDTSTFLYELDLSPKQTIVIDTQEDGKWSMANVSSSKQVVTGSSSPSLPAAQHISLATPGLCGLTNLGNTCFMNSTIQCLSNIPPLSRYFLSEQYIDELNEKNPLGMRGELARAYADVICNMWSGRHYTYMPRMFKNTVGRFQPMFSGYQQQDSQELMAFLLDGLHEDLNRIKKKPYVVAKDSEDRPDEELATEAWRSYKLRNDSIILDLFHGLLKSTVVCPECDKVSITFDPFCYLSLPLPEKSDRLLVINFVPLDADIPISQHVVGVNKTQTFMHVSEMLSSMVKVPSNRLIFAEVNDTMMIQLINVNDTLYKFTLRGDRLSNKIVAYETRPESKDEPMVTVCIFQKRLKSPGNPDGDWVLIGMPHLIRVPRSSASGIALYDNVLISLARYVDKPYRSKLVSVAVDKKAGGSNSENDEGFTEDDSEESVLSMVYTGISGIEEGRSLTSGPQVQLRSTDRTYCVAVKWNPSTVLVASVINKLQRNLTCASRSFRNKIDTLVSFPITNLDMSKWCIAKDCEPALYDLVSISNHYGGLGSGHYTAFAKNCDTKRWYNFDDMHVSVVSEEDIVTKEAYVLIYLRQSKKVSPAESDVDMELLLLIRFFFKMHNDKTFSQVDYGPHQIYHLEADDGVIKSVGWPNKAYGQWVKQRWIIHSSSFQSNVTQFHVEFQSPFSVEAGPYGGCVDHLSAYDEQYYDPLVVKPCEMSSHEPLWRFCGKHLPQTQSIQTNKVVIEFCSAPGKPESVYVGFSFSWYFQSVVPFVTTTILPKPVEICGEDDENTPKGIKLDENDEISHFGQIIGSHRAEANSWQWIAAVYVDQKLICGGTLIGSKWVLTSSACLHSLLHDMHVKLGVHDVGEDYLENEETQITCQVVERFRSVDNDDNHDGLALLKINCARAFPISIIPICLSDDPTLITGTDNLAVVIGWNNMTSSEKTPSLLQQAVVELVDDQPCLDAYTSSIDKNTICIQSFQGGQYISATDVGGPLIVHQNNAWYLYGVATTKLFPAVNERQYELHSIYLNVNMTWICPEKKHFCYGFVINFSLQQSASQISNCRVFSITYPCGHHRLERIGWHATCGRISFHLCASLVANFCTKSCVTNPSNMNILDLDVPPKNSAFNTYTSGMTSLKNSVLDCPNRKSLSRTVYVRLDVVIEQSLLVLPSHLDNYLASIGPRAFHCRAANSNETSQLRRLALLSAIDSNCYTLKVTNDVSQTKIPNRERSYSSIDSVQSNSPAR